MALIVEDGTGLANAESYLSVADADAYWVKMNDGTWGGLDTAAKESALRRATQYLDAHFSYAGTQKTAVYNGNTGQFDAAQALQWPRDIKAWPVVPIQTATAELALLASAGTLYTNTTTGDVIIEKVGPITTEYARTGLNGMTVYQYVEELLMATGLVTSSNTLGRIIMG